MISKLKAFDVLIRKFFKFKFPVQSRKYETGKGSKPFTKRLTYTCVCVCVLDILNVCIVIIICKGNEVSNVVKKHKSLFY